MLDVKLKALKRDYEQYFLGSRPREPSNTRAEMQKAMIRLTNGVIKNTGERFKFNTLNSQFVTYKRHWDDTLRKIETGTYKRHIFKANLHERERGLQKEEPPPAEAAAPKVKRAPEPGSAEVIFKSYMEAAESCGQNTAGLTPLAMVASALFFASTAIFTRDAFGYPFKMFVWPIFALWVLRAVSSTFTRTALVPVTRFDAEADEGREIQP